MSVPPPTPPKSEEELLSRARNLAGLTLQQLSSNFNQPLPKDIRHAKGWMGQLLETSLGATASSRAEPDFQLIQVELKTLPLTPSGKPKESTYVCTVPLTKSHEQEWATSWLKRKLQRVLWLPIEADKRIPLAERHIGNAILWSPNEAEATQLQQDWEELMELVCLGRLEEITSHMGRYLQIRPKGANSKSLTTTLDDEGNTIQTLPRGFYLRPEFTQQIIQNNYA
ncbi:MAG: DNA mismatch repair endonuclease MutH [Gammaproteobacteria bacterium]|nr:DNA mismatch repair endonuclease MutH [Gammaproteobacteria bacterium]